MKIQNTFVKIICQKILHLLLLRRKFTTSSKFEWASLVAQLIKNLPATQETLVQFLGWEDSPGGGHGNPLQHSCLEKPHGQKSLAGYSPSCHKEFDSN